MSNTFLSNYERLNKNGKFYVDCAMKAALSSPTCLLETPQEELEAIKEQYRQEQQRREQEQTEHEKHYEELKAECDSMTAEDYRQKLNEIFASLELYKLRYFYIFINAKLHM